MIPIPKFRLGTIFLIVACYAIGLTSTQNAFSAVEPTVAVAMLIGLVQEIRQLWRWTPPPSPPRASFAFARRFAIAWRCIVAALIFRHFALVFANLAFPDSQEILSHLSVLPSDFSMISGFVPTAYSLCVLLVLCNSIERWTPKPHADSTPRRRTRWLILLTGPLIILAMLQATSLMYFVHQAVAGIEAAQPERLHRPGTYITPVDENLFSFWFGSLSVAALVIGAAALFRFIRCRNFAYSSLWNLAATLPLLAVPSAFSAWYFFAKLRELSPDMFDGGFEAGRIDLISACALGIATAIVAAHKIARSNDFCDPPIANVEDHREKIPFHQTPTIVITIGLSGIYGLITECRAVLEAFYPPQSVWSAFAYIVSEPLPLLMLAHSLASLQLCWVRWRHRAQPVSWQIAAMSPAAGWQGLVATLLVLSIGAPTLHAFSFVCWLMPWDVKALLGY